MNRRKKISMLIIILMALIQNSFGSNKETEQQDAANINRKLTELLESIDATKDTTKLLESLKNILGSTKDTEKKDEININKASTEEFFKKENLAQYFPALMPYELQKLIGKYANTESWELQKTLPARASLGPLVYSPDGKHLSVSDGNYIRVFNTKDYSLLTDIKTFVNAKGVPEKLKGEAISFMEYSPNNKHLVGVSNSDASNPSPTIRIWDVFNNYRLLYSLKPKAYLINAISYSPDNKYLAYASNTKINILDVNNHYQLISTINTEGEPFENYTVTALAYSPDGNRIASGSVDGNIKIWGLVSANEKSEFTQEKNTMSANRISGFFKTIFNTSVNKLFNKTNLNYKLLDSFKANDSRETSSEWAHIKSLKYSPNNKYLASLDYLAIKIWDAQTYKLLHEIIPEDFLFKFKVMDFSPNDKYFATGSIDGTIKIWDAYTYNPLQAIENDRPITSLSFSADNSLAAAVNKSSSELAIDDDKGLIKIWQPKRNE